MYLVSCSHCQAPYPEIGVPYQCGQCGGYFDFDDLPGFNPKLLESDSLVTGMWRYRAFLGLPEQAQIVTLGEGATPLVWRQINKQPVAFKLEYINPTGSYKDRGASVLLSFLLSRQVKSAVEDSSGNAGAAFAAYAACAGINAKVFIPENASGPKVLQIKAYGAEVIRVRGPRDNATLAVKNVVKQGAVYASHAYLPQVLPGYATIAYEIFEQIGKSPGSIISPVGQGNLLLSIGRGFKALADSGLIKNVPALIGVQAKVCAPLWAYLKYGSDQIDFNPNEHSLAEGVLVSNPIRKEPLIRLIKQTGGDILTIDEKDILKSQSELAHWGFYVEPTSAIVWSALEKCMHQLPVPIVVILTGSGLKSNITGK